MKKSAKIAKIRTRKNLVPHGSPGDQVGASRQLSDTSFYAKVNKDPTSANQKTIKKTIQDLTGKQELPVRAQNLIVTTRRTAHLL